MIESNYTPLRPYTTFKSPDIQTVWKGDRYLINRVVLIAFKILFQNIGTFFYNRYAQLKNLVTWSKPPAPSEPPVVLAPREPQKPESPHEPTTPTDASKTIKEWNWEDWKPKLTPMEKFNRIWAPSAVILSPLLGTIAGNAYRAVKHIPSYEKYCDPKDMFLPAINSIKQWELKNFALASAVIVAAPTIYTMIKNIQGHNIIPKDSPYRREYLAKPLWKRALSELKFHYKYFFDSKRDFTFHCALAALALSSPLYAEPLGLKWSIFDSSSHVMLKTSLSLIMTKVFERTAWKHSKFNAAMASAYMLTDFTFLMNTTAFCHTRQETIAGLMWAGGVIAISSATAYLAEKFFNWNNEQKFEPTVLDQTVLCFEPSLADIEAAQ